MRASSACKVLTVSRASFSRFLNLVPDFEERIKAIEALTLDYVAPWPLSIVLSRRALTKYQLAFRQLFFTKYVERRLLATWKEHQALRELELHDGAAVGLSEGLGLATKDDDWLARSLTGGTSPTS